jgi:hypothetical protein
MENKIETKMKPGVNEIALRAYQLWEKGGNKNGRDREHWLEAEMELMTAWQASEKAVEADPVPDVSVEKSQFVDQRKPKTSDVERRNHKSRHA